MAIFDAARNTHDITVGTDKTFCISTDPAFNGFDFDRVTAANGNAAIDKESGCFTDIQGDITYNYDCGQGKTESFTLKVTFTDSYSLTAADWCDKVLQCEDNQLKKFAYEIKGEI